MDSRENKRVKIFSTNSVNPQYCFYQDQKNMLKIYLDIIFCEVENYLEFELKPNKGVFVFVTSKTSNFRAVHGHDPEINIEVAGFNDLVTHSRREAIEFMIAEIVKEINEEDQEYDIPAIKKILHEALTRFTPLAYLKSRFSN